MGAIEKAVGNFCEEPEKEVEEVGVVDSHAALSPPNALVI